MPFSGGYLISWVHLLSDWCVCHPVMLLNGCNCIHYYTHMYTNISKDEWPLMLLCPILWWLKNAMDWEYFFMSLGWCIYVVDRPMCALFMSSFAEPLLYIRNEHMKEVPICLIVDTPYSFFFHKTNVMWFAVKIPRCSYHVTL